MAILSSEGLKGSQYNVRGQKKQMQSQPDIYGINISLGDCV